MNIDRSDNSIPVFVYRAVDKEFLGEYESFYKACKHFLTGHATSSGSATAKMIDGKYKDKKSKKIIRRTSKSRLINTTIFFTSKRLATDK